ncbi:porin family protein [Nonlabens antarcticus]|uniref:hypothetical protein n=1 Tax=Nonlabens antarcticus TaxID=392714 RepID=UPI001891348F|nr:hypothetical protein [Nonlabens antarcticus]
MKKQLYFVTIILLLAGTFAGWAQEKDKDKSYTVIDTLNGEVRTNIYESEKAYLEILEKKKRRISYLKVWRRTYEATQRKELAQNVGTINARVESSDDYTIEMAQIDKETIAAVYADKIMKHNIMIDSEIAFVEVSDSQYDSNKSGTTLKLLGTPGITSVGSDKYRKTVSTTSGLTLGLGYNFINGDNLGIDDFSYGNNNYFSVGINWKTTLNKNQTLRFKYGIEYQTQGTELNGNRAFTITNPENTQIERLGFNARKAKFRQDQLVFPLHFEIGGTERREYEDGRVRYSEGNQFKFGVGGYAGLNMRSQLKYKYELEGEDIKQTTINSFDNNIFVYGVDAYVGFDSWTLFGRMGLNDIFKSGSVDGQYVAFGVRLQ